MSDDADIMTSIAFFLKMLANTGECFGTSWFVWVVDHQSNSRKRRANAYYRSRRIASSGSDKDRRYAEEK